MDTEATERHAAKGGGNPLIVFTISLCAAIVMAGGFGIVMAAFVVASANLFALGKTFVWAGSIAVGAATLWLALWTFARSWHVERRLRSGLEVDEPKVSILVNLRGN
ncbi:MAG: hypothetical protein ACREDO_11450 [Methyloceanibacter sp.]